MSGFRVLALLSFLSTAFGTHASTTASLAWIRQMDGPAAQAKVAVMSDHGLAVVGWFAGSLWFRGDHETTKTENSGRQREAYIARYGADGTLIWVRQIAGGTAQALGAAALPNGELVVSGWSRAPALLESSGGTSVSLSSGGAFLARYDSAGTLAWVKLVIPQPTDPSSLPYSNQYLHPRVSTAGDGTIRIAGRFAGSVVLGSGEAGETTLTVSNPLNAEGYLACFRPDGSLNWARRIAGEANTVYDVASESDGSTWITGVCGRDADFGSSVTLNFPNNTSNAFVARYSPDGTCLWAKAIRGDAEPSALAVRQGVVSVAGKLNGSAVFGFGEASPVTLSPTASTPPFPTFLARYLPDGSLAWVRLNGGAPSFPLGRPGVSFLPNGETVHAYMFTQSQSFGAGTPGQTTLTSEGFSDISIVSYSTAGDLLWAFRQGGNETEFPNRVSDFAMDVAADGSDFYVVGHFEGPSTFGTSGENTVTLTPSTLEAGFIARYRVSAPSAVNDWTLYE